MYRRLLDRMSLDAFRVFEAAARHMNFSAAARELLVTQAAVSRRIQKLETDLQADLFIREGRRLELTPKGETLYRRTQAALDFLSEGLGEIMPREAPASVVIAASGSISHLWLSRTLRDYVLARPDEDVRLVTSDKGSDLSADTNDLTVLYSLGAHPDWALTPLLQERLIPVAAPDYLSRLAPGRAPEDLGANEIAEMTLFDYARVNAYWRSLRDWFQWQGIAPDRVRPRVVFPTYPMAVDAALSGEGVMLGSQELLSDHLRAGRLVELSRQVLVTGYGYYLGLPRHRAPTPQALTLYHWLLATASGEVRPG